jgi:hypothetical protein
VCQRTCYNSMIIYHIIQQWGLAWDAGVQHTEVYISVAETQSLFDCLVDKMGDPENWTELCVSINGVHALGWRVHDQSGRWNPVRDFKARLDEHFRRVCMMKDRPILEIHLSVRRP